MTHAHGTVIVCERDHGATVAWVDVLLSLEVPARYFVEIHLNRHQEVCEVRVGTIYEGYLPGMHSDYGEAVQWCWRDARRWGKVA